MALAKGTPSFSYAPVLTAARDVLASGVPLSQAILGLDRFPRERLKQDFKELTKLLVKHYSRASNFIDIAPQFQKIAPDISVPFSPFLHYYRQGTWIVSVPLLWKSKELRGDALSLYVSLARDLIEANPSLSGSSLEILTFPVKGKSHSRTLQVVDTNSQPVVFPEKRELMFSQLISGFRLAQNEIKSGDPVEKRLLHTPNLSATRWLFDDEIRLG